MTGSILYEFCRFKERVLLFTIIVLNAAVKIRK